MHQPNIDRRVVKTRRALQHAFMNLILEKGYDAVSIQDICDAADVGRSTFYTHYTGKDELKRAGLEHLRRVLTAQQLGASAVEAPLGFSLAMFEHARGHLHLYRALFGTTGGVVALSTIRDILQDEVRKDPWFANRSSKAKTDEMAVQFAVGALMSVLTWWLDNGAVIEPREIDARFRQMIGAGVGTAIGSGASF